MDAKDLALLSLGRELQDSNYRFTTITPHQPPTRQCPARQHGLAAAARIWLEPFLQADRASFQDGCPAESGWRCWYGGRAALQQRTILQPGRSIVCTFGVSDRSIRQRVFR